MRRPAPDWLSRWSWCGPAFVTLVLGLWQVTTPELWRDELASWGFASRSLPELLAAGRHINAAQVPYYLLLHFWIEVFGPSVLSMRGLSVLAMAGAAAFVTLIARDLAGARAAVTSGLIFALIPSVSRFAQEVRFYALTMLFVALATWLLIRVLDRPSRARWAGYAAAMAAVGYTNLVAMSLLAGHGVWTVLRWRQDRGRLRLAGFAVSAAASLFVCAPLILLGSQQAADQVGWVPQPGFATFLYTQYSDGLFYSVPVAMLVFVLAAQAWATRRRRVVGYLTAATLCPVAVAWLISFGKVSYFFSRYELFVLITLAVLAGIAAARWGRVPAVTAIVLVAILGFADQGQLRQPESHNWGGYVEGHGGPPVYDWTHVAKLMGPHIRPGDGIVYTDNGSLWEDTDLGIEYYLKDYIRRGVPEPQRLLTAETAAQAHGLYVAPCRHPDQCLGHASRVWVVGDWPAWDPTTYMLPNEARYLREHYSVSNRWRAGAMEFALLIRHGTTGASGSLPGPVFRAYARAMNRLPGWVMPTVLAVLVLAVIIGAIVH